MSRVREPPSAKVIQGLLQRSESDPSGPDSIVNKGCILILMTLPFYSTHNMTLMRVQQPFLLHLSTSSSHTFIQCCSCLIWLRLTEQFTNDYTSPIIMKVGRFVVAFLIRGAGWIVQGASRLIRSRIGGGSCVAA